MDTRLEPFPTAQKPIRPFWECPGNRLIHSSWEYGPPISFPSLSIWQHSCWQDRGSNGSSAYDPVQGFRVPPSLTRDLDSDQVYF